MKRWKERRGGERVERWTRKWGGARKERMDEGGERGERERRW